jgi:serine/threonine protein kinase
VKWRADLAGQPHILGHYRIERTLGHGAMGVVYEGSDLRLQRRVAIKTILKTGHPEPLVQDYTARFLREAQAVARLNHPNIVQVYDFGEEGDISYIVMEFISGRDLKTYFDAGERFSVKEANRVMSELLDALDFAHASGVIHRDVKPANVMIDSQGRTKLTDFGVARLSDVERTTADRTQAGTMVGTPAYMSPEQVLGQPIDHRSDIFSAGVLLYQLLTGQKPFEGGAFTVARRIVETDPPPPSTIVSSISPEFDRIVARAIAKSMDQRYARAREFADAIRRLDDRIPTQEFDDGATILAPEPVRDTGSGRRIANRPPPVAAPEPHARRVEADLEFWRSIKDSTDPDDFDFYLEKFPDGIYVDLARRTKLKRTATASAEDSGTYTRRIEEEFWRAIKDSGDPDDISLYIEKFPQGLYIDLARRKVQKLRKARDVIEEDSGARSRQEDFWRSISESVDPDDYHFYLEKFPQGIHAELARRKIAKLTGPGREIGWRLSEKDNQAALERLREKADDERREAEERARAEAEAQSQRDAREKARHEAERAAREAQERARLEAEAKAGRDAEEAARRQAEEDAKREAAERARREAGEKARLEAEAKARRDAQEKATRDAAEKASREAAEKAQLEALAKAQREAEGRARRDAAEKAEREAAEKARLEAEAKAKRDTEERARREAAERAEREAAEKARLVAEAKARRDAEEQARRVAAERAEQEAAQKAQLAAEAKVKREAEERARRDAAQRAEREAAEKARLEAEAHAKRDADERARRDAAARTEREAAEKARLEAEAKAKREAAERAAREAVEETRLQAQAKGAAQQKAQRSAAEEAKRSQARLEEKERPEDMRQFHPGRAPAVVAGGDGKRIAAVAVSIIGLAGAVGAIGWYVSSTSNSPNADTAVRPAPDVAPPPVAPLQAEPPVSAPAEVPVAVRPAPSAAPESKLPSPAEHAKRGSDDAVQRDRAKQQALEKERAESLRRQAEEQQKAESRRVRENDERARVDAAKRDSDAKAAFEAERRAQQSSFEEERRALREEQRRMQEAREAQQREAQQRKESPPVKTEEPEKPKPKVFVPPTF